MMLLLLLLLAKKRIKKRKIKKIKKIRKKRSMTWYRRRGLMPRPIKGYVRRLYSKLNLIRSKRTRRLARLQAKHENWLTLLSEKEVKRLKYENERTESERLEQLARRRRLKNYVFYGPKRRRFSREFPTFSKARLLDSYLSVGNKKGLAPDYFPPKEPFWLPDPVHSRLYSHRRLFDFYAKYAAFFKWIRFSLRQDTPDFIYFAIVFFFIVFFFSFLLPFFLSIPSIFLYKVPFFFLGFFCALIELSRIAFFLLINVFIPFLSSFMVVQLVPEAILLLGVITILLLRAHFYQIYDFSFIKKLLRVAFKDGLVSLDNKSFETRLIGSWLPSFRETYVSNLAWSICFVSVFFADIWMLFNSADYVYDAHYVANAELSLDLIEENFIITGGINDVFFGNHFLYDSYTYYSRFLVLTTALAFLVIFKNELELDYSIRKVEYIVLIMCGLLFSIIMPAASSLISLFLVSEGLVMVMYILSSGSFNRYPSGEGSLKYAILNSISSVMFILGSIFILCADDIYFINLLNNDKIVIGLILIALTFLFKIGSFPFHNWMADLYESTSSLGILAFFILIPKLSIILTLINLSRLFFVKFSTFFFLFFLILGVLSFVVGAVLASSQTKISRLLAYSSISQAGSLLVLLSLVILNPFFPISLLFLFTVVYTLLLIQTISIMSNLRRGTSAISLLSQLKDISLIKFVPKSVQTLFSAFVFNLSGLPPFLGWVLKAVLPFGVFLLLFADTDIFLTFNPYNFLIWLSLLIFISSVVSVYYSIRIYKISYEAEPIDSFFPMISRDTSILSLTSLFMFCFVNFIGVFVIGYIFAWINYVIFS
jgi:NADH-quinone oxidoreductase subunit N